MSASACLVTSSPSIEDPERTPPFLLANSATPDIRTILMVDYGGMPLPMEFSAGIRSEDNDQAVQGRLILDYGINEPGYPYPYADIVGLTEVPPSTLDDISRRLSAQWILIGEGPPNGCHTISLFASHKFADPGGCPADPADFDFLTWTVFVCNSDDNPCCDPNAPPEAEDACTLLQCPQVDTMRGCNDASQTASFDPWARSNAAPGDAP